MEANNKETNKDVFRLLRPRQSIIPYLKWNNRKKHILDTIFKEIKNNKLVGYPIRIVSAGVFKLEKEITYKIPSTNIEFFSIYEDYRALLPFFPESLYMLPENVEDVLSAMKTLKLL